ncbi:MAG TPA: NUDIX domain-containing protein [Candidatus Saccharimonadales bacterium]|nr:NUDIX domain-containing protein [Candidatus Saccharimonadales bacterium]
MVALSVIALQLPNGSFVLQRRAKGARFSPGKLGFFGGHAMPGERPLDTARRELQEETSLEVGENSLQQISEFEMKSDAGEEMLRFTIYRMPIKTADFTVHDGQGAEVYTRKEALSRADLTPSVKYALGKLLA